MLKKIKNFFVKYKIQVILFVVLLFLACIPFLIYGNNIIVEKDISFELDPQGLLNRMMYSWQSDVNLGQPAVFGVTVYNIFRAVFDVIGIPSIAAKQIWLALLILSAGLSMFFFCRVYFGKNKYLLGVIASFFYIYNLYLGLIIWQSSTFAIPYALLPMILGLYYLIIRKKDLKLNILYVLTIGLLVALMTNLNTTNILWVLITLFIFYLFHTVGKNI